MSPYCAAPDSTRARVRPAWPVALVLAPSSVTLNRPWGRLPQGRHRLDPAAARRLPYRRHGHRAPPHRPGRPIGVLRSPARRGTAHDRGGPDSRRRQPGNDRTLWTICCSGPLRRRVPATRNSHPHLASQGMFRVFRVCRVYAPACASTRLLARTSEFFPVRVYGEHPEHPAQSSIGKAYSRSEFTWNGKFIPGTHRWPNLCAKPCRSLRNLRQFCTSSATTARTTTMFTSPCRFR